MSTIEIGFRDLGLAYLLFIFPLAIMLWYRIPLINKMAIAVIRMTVQLLFVGLYLQVVFRLNHLWLNSLWLIVMIIVADSSIIRSCSLPMKKFIFPVFVALIIGTAIPLLIFIGLILHRTQLMDAQYAIPIGGMILGNCLRADIIGLKHFYDAVRKESKPFQFALSQGATLNEAIRPYIRDACNAALAPTLATMATIGLVALPGMMTGVILGGANPMTAIKYQIAIMIAIFSGTAITVAFAIRMTVKNSFDAYGVLRID